MKRYTFLLLLLSLAAFSLVAQPPKTGPQTEKRFPPLKLPEGFKATLFACDPLIEYPSVIAAGPKSGSLYVAIDYMTGLGTDIVRRDEIRLVEDTDGDGYADKATVFATGFNSIQGIAYHNGTVYVMHAPYLSAVRDMKGTGKADERKDLLTGLGLAPEKDQIRLHNANGVTVGHDGWLYLSLGDRGVDIKRPEGDRLVLDGGGILRCRPNGRDLHVFSTGLRNIYDVSLDEDMNVFTRDNENDGGTYKIRVCHSFFGADHGYPYLYQDRPDEAFAPLADLGLGSSAGGVAYLETQFPEEYRGNLFNCEWGRSVVRYPLKRAGASFASHREIEFAFGAPTDPYGFKPTDLVVDRDGSLFVSDWADGQRPKRGRGRIYRIRHENAKKQKVADVPTDLEQLVARLDSESSFVRCQAQEALERRGQEGANGILAAMVVKKLGIRGRLHAIWVLAKVEQSAAGERLFAMAKSDPEPRVRAQAVRALADLTDPVLIHHRLAAGPGQGKLAERFAALATVRDPLAMLEIILALGRLRWADAPRWLHMNLKQPDAALAHAAQWAIRRGNNWPAVLKLLDESDTDSFRKIALRAAAEQYNPVLVDGLIERVKKQSDVEQTRQYADLLTRVYKKPATPWTYWGFRPPPRPANVVEWERTAAIELALDGVLTGANGTARLPVLRRMIREKIPVKTATLARWLEQDRHEENVAAILASLADRPAAERRPHLEGVFRDRKHAAANRLSAVALYLQGLDAGGQATLAEVAESVEDGPVLAELLRAIAKGPAMPSAAEFLLKKTVSESAEVRATSLEALAGQKVRAGHETILKLLGDREARVRGAAARAAGSLGIKRAAEPLLKLVGDPNHDVRRASFVALRQIREQRVLPLAVAALGDPETALEALECVGELGGVEQVSPVADLARRQPSGDMLSTAGKVLTGWAARKDLSPDGKRKLEQALAEIHGGGGLMLGWYLRSGTNDEIAGVIKQTAMGDSLPTGNAAAPGWTLRMGNGTEARLRLDASSNPGGIVLGYSEAAVADSSKVEFFAASSGPITLWLNGKVIFQRDKSAIIGPYPDRFEATLAKGLNRLLVRLDASKGPVEFQLRFRHRTATPERERLALASLSRAGNPERGRQVFLNAEKSLCVKCHRVGDKGERVGPELTGLGSRFSKVHIVESILEPSRTISPSFESLSVALKSGKVVNGLKLAENDTSLTLADNEGKKHTLMKSDVEELRKHPLSTMPDGLEKRLSEDEFVDLISFLVNLKVTGGR